MLHHAPYEVRFIHEERTEALRLCLRMFTGVGGVNVLSFLEMSRRFAAATTALCVPVRGVVGSQG
jgi:hypothetical protein